MSGDDERRGEASPLGPASGPPGEKERAIQEVSARLAAAAAQRAQAAARRAAPPPVQVGPTLRSPPVFPAAAIGDDGRAAPVSSVSSGVRHEVVPPPAWRPPVVPAPAHLKSTEPLGDLARWVPPSAAPVQPAAPPPRRAAPRTVQSRARGMGETTPAGDDTLERALAVAARVPPLTLRQYASLCAELAFYPDARGEILRRYYVYGDAEHAALDAYWRRERAARPESRAAFADDFATHTAFLYEQARKA